MGSTASRWVAAAILVASLIAADRLGLFGLAPGTDLERYDGKALTVSRVVDGDTVDLGISDPRHGHERTRVRLWGVDTPETVKPDTPPEHFGPEATEFTRDACLHREVTVQLLPGDTRDKYDRLLAYLVLPDGNTLNLRLVREGFGYADPRFDHPRKAAYLRAQDQARAERRGLWRDVTDANLPYYYRGKLELSSPTPEVAD
jgi:endonuclease YncB( thermonuclease family)